MPDKIKTDVEIYNDKKNELGTWLKKRMSWVTLVLASVLFAFKETLDFTRTGKDIATIVMGMSFTYLFTVYISIALRSIGKKEAKKTQSFKGALKYLLDAKENIKEILYLLNKFCSYKNDKALQEVKQIFLEENGLSYVLFNKGYYQLENNQKALTDKQKEILTKVNEIKISKLVPNELLAEYSRSKSSYLDPLYLGSSEDDDNKQKILKIMISKALLPIIFGYFAVDFAFSSSIVWGAIQVSIILLVGISHYLEGEDYVLGELKNRMLNKANFLIEFRTLYDNQKEIFIEEEKLIEDLQNNTKVSKYEQKDFDYCDPIDDFLKTNKNKVVES